MTDPHICPFTAGDLLALERPRTSIGLDRGLVVTADYLPLRCGVDHGWECCGCLDHPVGKPWGWNSSSWDEHWNQTTESEAE